MTLTATQASALRELDEVWPDSNAVIIGATALGFYYDMTWRQTADVDLALALDQEHFPGALLERPGWKQHPVKEHEFVSPHGDKIDVLPASRKLIATGELVWANGNAMNLTGMDLAFEHAERHTAKDYSVSVAPPTVVALLKMASYTDRPAERQRDLTDIAHLLDSYVDETSPRRWDEAIECEFDLAPAYLFGLDLGRIAKTPTHHQLVEGFLEPLGDQDTAKHAQMLRLGPDRWRLDDNALVRRLETFVSGFNMPTR